MTNSDIKLLIFIAGALGSIITALVGVMLFLWREARERYRKDMTACRALVFLVIYVCELVSAVSLADVDLDPSLIVGNSDSLMRNDESLNVLRKLIGLTTRIRYLVATEGQVNLEGVQEVAEELRVQAIQLMEKKSRSIWRFLLWPT